MNENDLRDELSRVLQRHNRTLADHEGKATTTMLDDLVEVIHAYRPEPIAAAAESVRPVGKAQRSSRRSE